MYKIIHLFIFVILGYAGIAQFPNANVSIKVNDTVLCGHTCTQLSAMAVGTSNTYSYRFDTIPYTAYPYDSGITIIDSIGPTSAISDTLDLPFPFCFFDSSYSQCRVDATGILTFLLDFSGTGASASPDLSIPSIFTPRLTIYAVFSSIYPFGRGSKVVYKTYGTAPNRAFVASFYRLTQILDHRPPLCTFQIILYEASNVIGINYLEKPAWGWASELRSILGIQNKEGDSAMIAPGRDGHCCYWSAYNQSWLISPTGTPHYAVTWYDASGTYIDSGLAISVCPTASTYYIAKLVNLNCGTNDTLVLYDTATVTIANPPIINLDSISPVSCKGNHDAYIFTSVGGGASPFLYQWNRHSSDTLSILNEVDIGLYALIVKDSNACSDTLDDILINEPDSLRDSFSNRQPICSGAQTGRIIAYTSGGSYPYRYALNGSPYTSDSIFNYVSAGTYFIHTIDAHDCDRYDTVVLYAPLAISLNIDSIRAVTCAGYHNAAIYCSGAGGSGSLNYVLDSSISNTDGDFAGLTAGIHNLYVTDSLGCSTSIDSIYISSPDSIIINASSLPLNCFGDSTGIISLHVNGGVSPFLFALNSAGFVSDTIFSGLPAGNYMLVVQDGHLCIDSQSISLSSPTHLHLSIDSIYTPLCFDSLGSAILIHAVGGIAPYLFSLNNTVPDSTLFYQHLQSANYSILVIDSNGCKDSTIINISNPIPLLLNYTTKDKSCSSSGSIIFHANGGTSPFQYSIDNGINYMSDSLFDWLDSGSYTIIVKDVHNCLYSDTIRLYASQKDSFFVTIDSVSCHDKSDGRIEVINANGHGLDYSYQMMIPSIINQTGIFDELSPGLYPIYIQQNVGDCKDTLLVNMANPALLSVDIIPDTLFLTLGDSVQLNSVISNGSNETYFWSPTSGLNCTDCPNPMLSTYQSGIYQLVVYNHLFDQNDTSCRATDIVYVFVSDHIKAYIPNAFTPNGDGINDMFRIYGEQIKSVKLFIYDRYGEQIFESNAIQDGWNGYYKGKPLEGGVYVYYAEVQYLDNQIDRIKGSVTLLK